MKKEKNLYYEKVKKYYWSVYDLNDYCLNIASFESIEELYDFIKNQLKINMSIKSLYNNILYKIPIINRYEIIKDNIYDLDNLKEF